MFKATNLHGLGINRGKEATFTHLATANNAYQFTNVDFGEPNPTKEIFFMAVISDRVDNEFNSWTLNGVKYEDPVTVEVERAGTYYRKLIARVNDPNIQGVQNVYFDFSSANGSTVFLANGRSRILAGLFMSTNRKFAGRQNDQWWSISLGQADKEITLTTLESTTPAVHIGICLTNAYRPFAGAEANVKVEINGESSGYSNGNTNIVIIKAAPGDAGNLDSTWCCMWYTPTNPGGANTKYWIDPGTSMTVSWANTYGGNPGRDSGGLVYDECTAIQMSYEM
jgi:hypothetical protein